MTIFPSEERRGMVAAAAAYTIFGFSYLFSKMALNITQPLILLSLRFTATFLVLNLLVLTRLVPVNLRGKPLLAPVIIGLIQPCLYFFLENYGIACTTASFSGMISALSPVFSAILGALLLKERPNGRQWLFIGISIVGVLLVSMGGSGGTNTPLGILCLLGAYLSGAFYSLLIRRYSRQFTPFELTYVMFHVGFVFFALTAFAVYRGQTLPLMAAALSQPTFLVSVGYLGIGCSVVAYFLVNYSLAKLPVARSTIFGSLATVVSVASGVVLMHDRFTPVSALAFVLILAGIAGVNRFQNHE